jgi:ppGpp synthetase/RelA/SpoT-type nucleotidyltranferase
MAWVHRANSKGEIDRAGRALVNLKVGDPARERAIQVVDNWRSCHAYPLQIIKMTLKRRALRLDKKALIAQRLKRRPSIEIKLRDNPNMQLSQMQDIGGCRAVLHSVQQVKRLVRKYKKSHAKSPKDRSRWDGSDSSDYISHPKPDGYRSVHLVFKFNSPSRDRQCFAGQRIEIQIRSKLQHLWATAVETAQVFTGQALKSRVKKASDDWLRFFALTSSAFAMREKCPLVPGTPENREKLIDELVAVEKRANIFNCIWGWSNTIKLLGEKDFPPDVYVYLLKLDPNACTLDTKGYPAELLAEAQGDYERAEKETENDPSIQVVLVAVDDVEALKKAYPNYYVDTDEFLDALNKELSQ